MEYQWINDSSLLLGCVQNVRTWTPVSQNSEILFLSQAKKFGWKGESDSILAKNDYGTFQYDMKKGVWSKADNTIMRDQASRNNKWRIFLDKSQNSAFENTLFCRELNAESYNRPLFDYTARKIQNEKPKVALTIDCLDNADGLTEILSSLSRYGIKATFFINGEFVRRFPTAVNEILKAGHQCGSMFYSPYFMNEEGYDMNENFIRRGLARNEDEFFEQTQKELSLVWHMPNYYSNNIIQKAGSAAGYLWIDKGLAPPDSVTYENVISSGKKYYSSAQMIDSLVSNLYPGCVIPISAGISNGSRGDYLYDNLDVLISSILSKGYQIVTVSEMLQSD
ncbi:MAG: polysaccharide deacetylase family protein [Treponemataceae bacterium]|nr:polysaccharide deacetylase family protein [Treponemataceae bacterium]